MGVNRDFYLVRLSALLLFTMRLRTVFLSLIGIGSWVIIELKKEKAINIWAQYLTNICL